MCWFLYSLFSCHFHNRPVTFLGSPSLLSTVGPWIDFVFPAVVGEKHCFSLRYLLACCSWSLCGFGFFWFGVSPPSPYIFVQFYSMSGTQILDPYCLLSSTDYFSMCERTFLILMMYVYNLLQPFCIYNKDSRFQSWSLIKVWHSRISCFSMVIRHVIVILQSRCRNLTWQYPWRHFPSLH